MAILHSHIPLHREVFDLPGVLAEPLLVFGYQDVAVRSLFRQPWRALSARKKLRRLSKTAGLRARALLGRRHPEVRVPEAFWSKDLVGVLEAYGLRDVTVLDLFDPRAHLAYDMNEPVPEQEHGRYASLLDIGCLEHVFDTRQCLESCLRMLRPGGSYYLHTNVNGCFGHGLHVFSPEALLSALERNGCEIVHVRYSTPDGVVLAHPEQARDAIIWLVARKRKEVVPFVCPQQGKWRDYYAR